MFHQRSHWDPGAGAWRMQIACGTGFREVSGSRFDRISLQIACGSGFREASGIAIWQHHVKSDSGGLGDHFLAAFGVFTCETGLREASGIAVLLRFTCGITCKSSAAAGLWNPRRLCRRFRKDPWNIKGGFGTNRKSGFFSSQTSM